MNNMTIPQQNSLIIGDTVITTNDGLYCLNDLHKASGLKSHKKPSEWLRNKATQEIVQELSKEGIPALLNIQSGTVTSSYGCKDLAYSYAMWLSPKFHIIVVRAYDAMVTNQVPVVKSEAQMLLSSVQLLVAQEKKLSEHDERLSVIERALASPVSQQVNKPVARIAPPTIPRVHECPANAMQITRAKKHARFKYGIAESSARALLLSSNAPRIAYMVINDYEGANGQATAAWHTSDLNALFAEVIKDMKQETPAKFSHPYLDKTFMVKQGK